MAKAPNYSAAQEAKLREVAEAQGLNLETCQELADTALFEGKTARGLVAKARSMGLDYAKKVRTDKTGEPVVQKAALAAQIEQMLNAPKGAFESLAKAEKPALKALAEAIKAFSFEAAE